MKKEIPNFPGYYADEEGNIYGKQAKILKKAACNNGYFMVTLSCNGITKNVLVHRLIASTFIPNPDNKAQVNHINSDKHDNRVENLEWNTRSENQLHRVHSLGKGFKGENNLFSKLTEKEVKEIYELKMPYSKIANLYNISISTVHDIKKGETWCHVTGETPKRRYKRWTTL